jgi:hypothetical protein
MKEKIYLMVLISILLLPQSCKKPDLGHPALIMKKWESAVSKLDYREYCKIKAYPRGENVFREMYSDYYMTGMTVTAAGEVDENDVQRDYQDNRYVRRPVSFECNIVNRKNNRPYQLMRGDVVLIKFLDGKRPGDGWLISNMTIIRTDNK